MRAVVIRQFGEPETVQVEDVSQPSVSAGQALVKVLCAGINPGDLKNIQGKMAGTTLPRIPGRDFAGVVVEGPSAQIGREVWGTGGDIGFTRDGSHAQYMLIPVAALSDRPANVPMEVAGAAGLTFVTAWSALVSAAGIGPKDTTLILGATGGVGSAAVQISRLFGATTIAAVRHKQQAEQTGKLGAHSAIDTSTGSLVEQVRAQTEGRGVDVVFDTTGQLFAESVEAAALGGRVCVISAPSDGLVNFNLRSLYRKELRILGIDSRHLDVTACSKLLAEMAPAFQERKLQSDFPATYPLDQARAAYHRTMEGKGRCCLLPNE